MFAAVLCRPDIAYVVGEVSHFLNKHDGNLVSLVKRIFKYLQENSKLGITFGSHSTNLKGYTNADFARDSDTRKSTTRYVFPLGEGPITWRSQRQITQPHNHATTPVKK